jgi:hypothetical protein
MKNEISDGEVQSRQPGSRWVGRLVALFALCATFALLSQVAVIPINAATWVVIGVALGFAIRNVE